MTLFSAYRKGVVTEELFKALVPEEKKRTRIWIQAYIHLFLKSLVVLTVVCALVASRQQGKGVGPAFITTFVMFFVFLVSIIVFMFTDDMTLPAHSRIIRNCKELREILPMINGTATPHTMMKDHLVSLINTIVDDEMGMDDLSLTYDLRTQLGEARKKVKAKLQHAREVFKHFDFTIDTATLYQSAKDKRKNKKVA
jgi:hypothetical protein